MKTKLFPDDGYLCQTFRPMKPIAHIHTDFPAKFGIPRQSGLVDTLEGQVVFEPAFRHPDAVRGLESFSHIWLIWEFSETARDTWSPVVRPPRLGGNRTMGVFATRSPFRPNPIGLSLVRLLRVVHGTEGPVLHVAGADLMDGTPIYDIKPYIRYTDCRPEASDGYVGALPERQLEVVFPDSLLQQIPDTKRAALLAVLQTDPRPAYQEDGKACGMAFAGHNIRFRVREGVLYVEEVGKI